MSTPFRENNETYSQKIIPYICADCKQKHTDVEQFLKIVRNRTEITELTPEIMHEFIEKIVVHAPDKSSGHRKQKIEIHFRFNVASWEYDKKKKVA